MQSDDLFVKRKMNSSPQRTASVFDSKLPASFGIKVKPVGNDGHKVKSGLLDFVDERPKFDYSSFSSSSETDESSSDDDKYEKHLSQPLENCLSKGMFKKKEENCSKVPESNGAESAPKSENLHGSLRTVDDLRHGFEFDLAMQKCMTLNIYDGIPHNATAIELFKHGFIDFAIHKFKWAAEYCDCTAAYFNLGLCFERKNDLEQAYECYMKAATKKHAVANYNVGCLILRNPEFFSEKCGKDKGISFVKTASELGLAQAQSLYGSLLFDDQTDDVKAKEAVRLFEKASGQKCYNAMYFLGICHENGWGVVKDDVQAAKLYHEASEGDHSEAQHNLGVFYEHGHGGLEKSKTKALKLYTRAVENGHKQTCVDKERLERSMASGDTGAILNEKTSDKLQMNQGLPSSSLSLDGNCEVSFQEEA